MLKIGENTANSKSTLKVKKVNLDCFISHPSIHLPVFPVKLFFGNLSESYSHLLQPMCV